MCFHFSTGLLPELNVGHVNAFNELVHWECVNVLAQLIPSIWIVRIVSVPESCPVLGKSTMEFLFVTNFSPLLNQDWFFATLCSILLNANHIPVNSDDLADFPIDICASRGTEGFKVGHPESNLSFSLYAQGSDFEGDPMGQFSPAVSSSDSMPHSRQVSQRIFLPPFVLKFQAELPS